MIDFEPNLEMTSEKKDKIKSLISKEASYLNANNNKSCLAKRNNFQSVMINLNYITANVVKYLTLPKEQIKKKIIKKN